MTTSKYKALSDAIVLANPDISEIDEEGNEIRRDIGLEDVLHTVSEGEHNDICSISVQLVLDWQFKKPLHEQFPEVQDWLYSVIVKK